MPGIYAGKPRPFCLPTAYSQENLFQSIRAAMLEYFTRNRIVWHCGDSPGYPTNHLCSSQVFTINLFAAFRNKPEALAALLHHTLPDIASFLPIEAAGNYLAFEWIPPDDLFDERQHRGIPRSRRRGIGCTSIDVAFLVRTEVLQVVLCLCEVKYTESYPQTRVSDEKASKRLEPYLRLLSQTPWNITRGLSNMSVLAAEPLYQIFRHHVLAYQIMLRCHHKIDEVRLLHFYVADKLNNGRTGNRSPVLHGHTGFEIFESSSIPFHEISINELVGAFPTNSHPNLLPWRRYLEERYRL